MSLDITPVDTEKWYFRIAFEWFIKKYSGGKNSKIIHDEMVDCGNPVIRHLMRLKDEIKENIYDSGDPSIIDGWQKNNIDKTVEFFLWILYKDTAYRQIFFWAMKNLMDDKKELMPEIMRYYTEPKDWYVNIWNESKRITKKQRDGGIISNTELSDAEKFFVPNITAMRSQFEELERERKKKGVK